MDARNAETLLQIIVGTRETSDVLAAEQPRGEIVGDVAKVLKGFYERPQRREVLPHLLQVRQIAFSNPLAGLLGRIRQDRFGLIQEVVRVLKRRPEFRCRP